MRGICAVFARYLRGIGFERKIKNFHVRDRFCKVFDQENLYGIGFATQFLYGTGFATQFLIRDWFCDPQSLQISKRRRTKVPKVPKVPEFHA